MNLNSLSGAFSRSARLVLSVSMFFMMSITAVTFAPSQATAQTADPCVDPYNNQTRIAVCRLVNKERQSRGLAPVTLVWSHTKVAKNHSTDMYNRNYFSHTSPEGLRLSDRLKKAGIPYNYAGENIAWGQPDAAKVMAAWMASSGHRSNILKPEFRKMGIGKTYSYWTQVFTN